MRCSSEVPGTHMSSVTKPEFGEAIAEFLGAIERGARRRPWLERLSRPQAVVLPVSFKVIASSAISDWLLRPPRRRGLAMKLSRRRLVGAAESLVRLKPFAPFADLVGETADLVADLVAARPQEDAGRDRAADRRGGGEWAFSRAVPIQAAILVVAFGIVVAGRDCGRDCRRDCRLDCSSPCHATPLLLRTLTTPGTARRFERSGEEWRDSGQASMSAVRRWRSDRAYVRRSTPDIRPAPRH